MMLTNHILYDACIMNKLFGILSLQLYSFYTAQLKYASVDVHLVLFIINYTLYHRMAQSES